MCNIDNLSGYIFSNIYPPGEIKKDKNLVWEKMKRRRKDKKQKWKKRGKEKRKITINSPNLRENLEKKCPEKPSRRLKNVKKNSAGGNPTCTPLRSLFWNQSRLGEENYQVKGMGTI